MSKEKTQSENSEAQTLEMASQALGRVKEMDLTAEQKKKVMNMIDQARKYEDLKQPAKALNIYNQLLSYLESIGLENMQPERINKFKKKALDFIRNLLDAGADKVIIAEELIGLDTKESWELRSELLEDPVTKNHPDYDPVTKSDIVSGLAGLNSEKAWKMRQEVLDQNTDSDRSAVAESLAGLDSERAWKMRQEILEKGIEGKNGMVIGLTGLESDKAWEMRQNFLKGKFQDYAAESLAGMDSERAWKMRQDLLDKGVKKEYVAAGLAGLDSDRAWNMRREILAQEVDEDFLNIFVFGLAGLDSAQAWSLRRLILPKHGEKGIIARGVFSNYLMVGVYKARENKIKNIK